MIEHKISAGGKQTGANFWRHYLLKDLLDKFGPILILLLMLITLSTFNPFFGQFNNFMLITLEAATIGIVAAGQTLVILSGGIDLSVGSLVGLTGVIAAGMMKWGVGPIPPLNSYLALLMGLLMGTLAGLLNGLLITRFKISPFIITLATLSAFKGLALVYSNASPIHLLPDNFKWLSDAHLWRIPMPAVLMVVVYFFCWCFLSYTTLGRHSYAIGGNELTARLTGVDVNKCKLYIYGISGFLSALAGVILISRLDGGIYTNGEGYELHAIAAVVIGGASLMGGHGGIWGTLVGVLIITTINNALVMYSVPAEWKSVMIGTIIILAVLIDVLRKQSRQA
ncbi:MAG: ABC transporter permease [Anaerolineae bacterium]|nr:ABC transporter permease [Anaerolineae bacterium]